MTLTPMQALFLFVTLLALAAAAMISYLIALKPVTCSYRQYLPKFSFEEYRGLWEHLLDTALRSPRIILAIAMFAYPGFYIRRRLHNRHARRIAYRSF